MGRTSAGGYADARTSGRKKGATEKQNGAHCLCGQELVGKHAGLDQCVISTQQAL